jgi:putative transposase
LARQPRLTVAGYPHHVIQRGNDRQAIVRDDADRERLLALWQEHAQTFKVAIHAYVIMDNHFHLLLTPDTDTGLPQMMQAVGRAYVRYFNLRHQRTGTLWEGRYRSNLIVGGAVSFGVNAVVLDGIEHGLRVGQAVQASLRF